MTKEYDDAPCFRADQQTPQGLPQRDPREAQPAQRQGR